MAKTIKGITIEIGGNTVNLGKSLKNVDKISRDLNTELSQINRQLKFNPSSSVLLAQKQEVLKDSISAAKDKLKELEAVQQDIERAYKNGEIDDGQYRAYQREIEQTQNKLEGYERELKSAKNNQAEFDKKIEQARLTLERNKTGLKVGIKTVGKYGAAVIGALGAAAGASIKYAADFETAFAKTTTLLDEKTIDLDKYKKEIIKVSNETGVEASKIATSVYDAISAGVDPKKAVKFVKTAEKLSKGGFTEIGKSVDILSTILNAYQFKVSKTNHISNVLLQTQNKGKVLVGELAQYMGKVIPVASSYGVSLENVASGYAILTARGIKAAQATTYMKSLFDELAKVKYDKKGGAASLGAQIKELTGKTFEELMKSGKSVGDVLDMLYKSVNNNNTAFGAMFSKSNARAAAFSLMKAGADKFNSTLKEMKNSAGVADSAYSKMADTAAHKTEVLKTNIQNSAIAIGDGMLPAVSELLEYIEKNLPAIQNMAQELGKKIGTDLEWVLANGDKIISDIKALVTIGGSVYAAFKLKQFISAIGETVAAIRVLKLATDAETASQIALNTAQKANVIGLVVSGLVTLAGVVWASKTAFDEYTKATSALTAEEKELYNQSKEDAKALTEEKKAREESLAAIDSEYGHYDKLREELDKIVDGNGKVKKGYEERAKFITSTLSEKLGIEFEWNKNIIKSYKDIRKQIKETIKAKREEAKLSAYKSAYEEAVKVSGGGTKSKGYTDYTSAVLTQKRIKKDLTKAETDIKYITKYPGRDEGYTNPEWTKANNKISQLKKDLKEANDTVTNTWKKYSESRDLINNYEKASAAIIEGKHRLATKALNTLTDELITAGNATNEAAGKQLIKQFNSAQSAYNQIATAYKNGEKGITRKMVKEAQRRLDKAKEAVDKYRANVADKAKKAAGSIGNNLTKTDTDENKEKAAKRGENLKKPVLSAFTLSDEEKERLQSLGKKVVNQATNKEVRSRAKERSGLLGDNFINGFISVVSSSVASGNVFSAAFHFVKAALAGIKAGQKSNSPSKETMKLSGDAVEGYLIPWTKNADKAYKATYSFVHKGLKGARSAQEDFSISDSLNFSKNSADYNINSSITHSLIPATEGFKKKDNTPKVSVSSPIINIEFGDITVRDERDIHTLSQEVSETIAAEIVAEQKARGG
ncbi:MAG: phage tail tape measure protein [Ruminococcus sp.]|nr:phage tail tape measure protein [Ruminococcus sp.]